MINGVTIRMEKRVSLSTVALLSLLWDKKKRDYLDVIAQFVLRCIPTDLNVVVNTDDVTTLLRSEYGFDDIPHHVVEKVLGRLSHRDINGIKYLRRENHLYYTNASFNRETFDKNRSEINNHISEVLIELEKYLEGHYLHRKLDQDEAAGFLFHFFETYGLTVMHDASALRSITSASGEHNFFVARFILDNIERKTSIANRLIEITTGFLIYKAVYFYSSEMKVSVESKLRNTYFYLDCSVIIDGLGYDSASDEQSFDEMCQLIRSNGGHICVFEHTIEEAGKLLEAYANKPQKRNAFSFPELAKRNYPTEVLFSLAQPSSIAENLRKKGIDVCQIPTYNPQSMRDGAVRYPGFQDESAIMAQMRQYQHKRNTVQTNSSRVNYDVKTLSAIGRLRRDKHPTRIESCKAIVITQDYDLCRCMHDIYPKQFPPEIDFAIKDIDLVSLLWLSQYNKESQLPKNILIANAVAACHVTQDIMDQAIDLAYRMEKDKTISAEAALIIRSAHAVRTEVFEKTRNNPDYLTEDAVKDIIAAYVEHESAPSTQRAIEDAVNRAAESLNTQHRLEMSQANDNYIQICNERRDQAIQMRSDAEAAAKKYADIARGASYVFLFIIWLGLVIGSVVCWIKSGIASSRFAAIILSILSLLQIADYLFKFINIPKKVSDYIKDWVFTKAYNHEVEKRERFSHMSLRI